MKYAGVGSREAPLDILNKMKEIAKYLAQHHWTLRSGGADGADLAFELGCDEAGGTKEIFLPWKGFNGSTSQLYNPTQAAFDLAATIHPAWNRLSYGAKKLHARNAHQVLGINLDEPAGLVICWTKGGKEVGGTATAIKIAKQNNIRVVNLAIEDMDVLSIS